MRFWTAGESHIKKGLALARKGRCCRAQAAEFSACLDDDSFEPVGFWQEFSASRSIKTQ